MIETKTTQEEQQISTLCNQWQPIMISLVSDNSIMADLTAFIEVHGILYDAYGAATHLNFMNSSEILLMI